MTGDHEPLTVFAVGLSNRHERKTWLQPVSIAGFFCGGGGGGESLNVF